MLEDMAEEPVWKQREALSRMRWQEQDMQESRPAEPEMPAPQSALVAQARLNAERLEAMSNARTEIEEAMERVKSEPVGRDYMAPIRENTNTEIAAREAAEAYWPGVNQEHRTASELIQEREVLRDRHVAEIGDEIVLRREERLHLEAAPASRNALENNSRQLEALSDRRRREESDCFRDTKELRLRLAEADRKIEPFRDRRYRL